MGQRAFEQRAIGEAITDAIFERGGAAFATTRLFRSGRTHRISGGEFSGRRFFARDYRFCFLAATHLTSVNSRSHRTAQGQRQTSQAWASSRMEKKISCALPIRFSTG